MNETTVSQNQGQRTHHATVEQWRALYGGRSYTGRRPAAGQVFNTI